MGNLFENVDLDDIVIDPDKDYFSELVGEGKKYKDPVAAGRALAEKDAHIARIERENKEYREKVKTTQTLEEIVNQIREARALEQSNQNDGDNQGRNLETPAIKKEDIEALLEERLTKRDRDNIERNNLSSVMEMAEKVLGPNYQRELEKRRQALGLGQDFLTDVARKNPKAFAKIMELDEKKDMSLFSPPVTERNPVSNGHDPKKNWKYYQKLRRDNPQAYAEAERSLEILRAAENLGEAFYS